MIGADFVQAVGHNLVREFGAIAVTAEVSQIQVLQLSGDDLFCDVRSRLI